MDRWHKGAACCPVRRDKGGVTGRGRGVERGEEGREKGGVALQGAAGAESCHCPCVTLQCTHSIHTHVKQCTKDKRHPELDGEYHVHGMDFISAAICPWSAFNKDYINSSDHKRLMRQQGIRLNPIIHLIYHRGRKNWSNTPISHTCMYQRKSHMLESMHADLRISQLKYETKRKPFYQQTIWMLLIPP